ncbi:bi-domain-containing oxidoreductase [Pontivivens insulae]|uniref:Scyllo-inositol 2-dehydrogenase (NAD(+)) n=1 Tax=Pontivivens insulae TaxID=1639689 RepID=A0A2R8A7F8_9RHOB|nr:bi-domain-containing oxidoreductase [Pontivivens insulae]RED18265.1 putative dehydrogenase [Pontivivens insulae]SPF28163.1 scyllo-inositol 2-dehydrogenase (NAD(+)) [Pontivivens insulae]
MKQILQNLGSGKTELTEIPCPAPGPQDVIVRTSRTLVSPGTERMLVEFGRAGFIGKARQQPERVREVLNKMRTNGIAPTLEAVFHKLGQPLPLGYCNVGQVLETGGLVEGFAVEDRVVSNGHHAEAVCVGKNMCAKIPDTVSDDAAAFTVLGAIALQGVRLAKPTLGETFVVSGLGLIGLITVQILRANGCRVIGLDYSASRLELARRYGAETVQLGDSVDPVAAVSAMIGHSVGGVDGVLITAATTSNDPVSHAAKMSRKRGRIILVGVAGLELSRADFYEKELTFQVSCSYGPGRYDPDYETAGFDYPPGFVRWTEQRNFEAVLGLMACGQLDVSDMMTDRFDIDQAEEAYEALANASAETLGILLTYRTAEDLPEADLRAPNVAVPAQEKRAENGPAIAMIGAGNHTARTLGPAFKKAGAQLHTIVSQAGISGTTVARQLGFANSSTDFEAVLTDPDVNIVVISTRHDLHADQVCAALGAGKHVFIEKPLALTHDELDRIEAATAAAPHLQVMVGFNRRFAPQVEKMKSLIRAKGAPIAVSMNINAGAIPADHWTQDRKIGGGRIIGEACHFLDLARDMMGSRIADAQIMAMDTPTRDSVAISLRGEDGSLSTIQYLANGPQSLPKERFEVFCGGQALYLDNFRHLRGYNWKGFSRMRQWRQDKGHAACAHAFIEAVRKGDPTPIPASEMFEVSRLSIDLAERIA